MAAENGVILSVDTSGSVWNCRDYYAHIRVILDEIRSRLGDVPIISWSSSAQTIPLDQFMTDYVEVCEGAGGTNPSQMVATIEEVFDKHKMKSFELIITTDGEIDQSETVSYCDLMKKSKFFDKITNVRTYFIGAPQSMNTNITHAFEDIPLSMAINEHLIVPKKNLELAKDERFTNFKIENVSSLVDDLAIQLSVLPSTQENRSAIRRLLDQVKEKYLKELFSQGVEEDPRDPAQIIHDLLAEWKIAELKKYYLSLFTKQKDDTNDKKINKLYSLLHKDHVQCYDLMCFIPAAMDTDAVKQQLDELAPDDEVEPNDNYMDREKFCAIYYIESTLPVLQLQKLPANTILEDEKDNLYQDRNQLARCPLQLFDRINVQKLSEALLADHVSAEAFVNLFRNESPSYGDFTFKSTCDTEAYGIMLYNFPNSTEIDLYLDKNSELYKEKTELDKNIVNHICSIIADYFLHSREIKGNRGLWAISFLYLLYSTPRIQGNEYLKRCIRYTIIRISLVFKCNVTLFKGVQPQVSLSIHDALLCSLHIASTVFQTDNNITRRLDECGPLYVQMMERIFVQNIPKEICFDDWFSWKYLFRISKDVHYRNALEPIIKTKVQDWINTESGPLILEGKTDEAVYDEAIKKSKIDVLYKMVQILKDTTIQATKGFNYSKIKVDVPADVAATKIRSPCRIDHHKHTKVCRSTCRPTFLCSLTGRPWYKCVPEKLRETPVSFYNLYGKYVRKIKKFPTVEEFMAFLVKKYPGEVYYKNTEELLSMVVEEFNSLDLDPKTFKKRYNSSTNEDRRIKMETGCDCSAHIKKDGLVGCWSNTYFMIFIALICILISVGIYFRGLI